jgi:hypothetical protein
MNHIAQGWQCPQCRGIYAPTTAICMLCMPKKQRERSPAELDRAFREFEEAREKQRSNAQQQTAEERMLSDSRYEQYRMMANAYSYLVPSDRPYRDALASAFPERC